MTTTYIGVKVIEAWREDRADQGEGYGVRYADGYTSWSPKDVFEAAYHEVPADEAQDALNRATTTIIRPGLTTLDPKQAALIAKGRKVQGALNTTIDMLKESGEADPRALALAQTNFDQAFMWLTSAIAKPERPVGGDA